MVPSSAKVSSSAPLTGVISGGSLLQHAAGQQCWSTVLGHQHWSTTLVTSTGNSTGRQHWSTVLVNSTGQ